MGPDPFYIIPPAEAPGSERGIQSPRGLSGPLLGPLAASFGDLLRPLLGSLLSCLFSLLSSLFSLLSSLFSLLSSLFSLLSSLFSHLSSLFSLLSSLFSLLSCLLSFFSLAEERERTETKKSLGAPRRALRALCGALGRPLASFGEPWDALGSSLSPQEALGESLGTPRGTILELWGSLFPLFFLPRRREPPRGPSFSRIDGFT